MAICGFKFERGSVVVEVDEAESGRARTDECGCFAGATLRRESSANVEVD